MNHQIIVRPDGTITGIKSPITEALGLQQRKRVSHIEPVSPWLRGLFHAVRRRVADDSRLAAFTRQWPCKWQVRFLGSGELLGPFNSRQLALEAEIAAVNLKLEKQDGEI